MAAILKVNKSSFYWHFKTKKEFIEQLVLFWVNRETERIIILTNCKKTVRQKFKTLIALIYKQDPFWDFIFYLKRYAREEKKIQIIIEKIDNQRIEYTNNLLLEMGYSKQDAKIKSTLLHKHFIGYHEVIRYKKQKIDYQKEVEIELAQIIKFKKKQSPTNKPMRNIKKLFSFNQEEYPESWHVYYDLAYSYKLKENIDLAKTALLKAKEK